MVVMLGNEERYPRSGDVNDGANSELIKQRRLLFALLCLDKMHIALFRKQMLSIVL